MNKLMELYHKLADQIGQWQAVAVIVAVAILVVAGGLSIADAGGLLDSFLTN